jgi:hypothetical protein
MSSHIRVAGEFYVFHKNRDLFQNYVWRKIANDKPFRHSPIRKFAMLQASEPWQLLVARTNCDPSRES